MRVISESSGFALSFRDAKDLDHTIKQLVELRRERKESLSKSWPAIFGIYCKKAPTMKENRIRVRWLRYALGEHEKFSD